MVENLISLDPYLPQQDMRVRLPKSILSNLGAEKGKTQFDIYYNLENNSLVLSIHKDKNNDS